MLGFGHHSHFAREILPLRMLPEAYVIIFGVIVLSEKLCVRGASPMTAAVSLHDV
jgi:hypothetical protein